MKYKVFTILLLIFFIFMQLFLQNYFLWKEKKDEQITNRVILKNNYKEWNHSELTKEK